MYRRQTNIKSLVSPRLKYIPLIFLEEKEEKDSRKVKSAISLREKVF